MAENSKIEWTDHTFNGWIGCTKVSPACDNCYAEVSTPARVSRSQGNETWGPHSQRKRTSASNWKKPLKWNEAAKSEGVRKRVFCLSLGDVFDNHRSIMHEWRDDLWALIKQTPHLDWLLLTKRPQNIEKYLPEDWGTGYPNVWLGVTVENQDEANRRIPVLMNVPAVIRFLSCEPLLGPLNLREIDVDGDSTLDALSPPSWEQLIDDWRDTSDEWELEFEDWYGCHPNEVSGQTYRGIDWVICGGESGAGARPLHPKRAFDLWYQCKNTNTPFLFKQWGEYLHKSFFNWGAYPNAKAEFIDGSYYVKTGKKKAGRYLCAEAQSNEFPTNAYSQEMLDLRAEPKLGKHSMELFE